MPVIETTTLNISCDNPSCPGVDLPDADNREGWTFITSEVYGQQTQSHVFCCRGCVSSASAPHEAEELPAGQVFAINE